MQRSAMKTRSVTESTKKAVAGRQFYKCANTPLVKLDKLEDYKCPLWEKGGENAGSFDPSGYDVDHVIEFSISFDDSEDNLQALCKSCHSVKTKKFMRTSHRSKKKKQQISGNNIERKSTNSLNDNTKIQNEEKKQSTIKKTKDSMIRMCDGKRSECKINGPYDYGKGPVYRYRWSCCGSQAKSHP